MKYVDEYRDWRRVHTLVLAIRSVITRPWTIMEVCGGQTHTIVKYAIEDLLPPEIEIIHGPGCPVCVTSLEAIDRAIAIASKPDVIFASFGDMLRVPGSEKDLLTVKAEGGDVRIVYSPIDAVRIARMNPGKKIVFFGVGFETTAPAHAMAVRSARDLGLKNFFLLCSQVLVPPALHSLLSSPENRIQAILAAGHVCTVTGYESYEPIAARYRVPIVVTGFEPVDILRGLERAIVQLEAGDVFVENAYARAVRAAGNPDARKVIDQTFEVCDRSWRGLGPIPASGLKLRREFSAFDAETAFETGTIVAKESSRCLAGLVLQGRIKPGACTAFGTFCTPEHPLGAPMVSSEGACAAYYRFGRRAAESRIESVRV